MKNTDLQEAFSKLSTPLVTDACLRLDIPPRVAPPGIRPVLPGVRIAGRVLPARHYGSVDVLLEAMHDAAAGDVLVIDNGGRTDEACIGDLAALEAKASGLAGMMTWGLHRDTAELREIRFPVFSYGALPAGPQRLDDPEDEALVSARFGSCTAGKGDIVFADDDGVAFVAADRVREVIQTAQAIASKEREQADDVRSGVTLREQLRFSDFLDGRSRDSSLTFRQHLRQIGGAIEE